jgi:hypothetical protein
LQRRRRHFLLTAARQCIGYRLIRKHGPRRVIAAFTAIFGHNESTREGLMLKWMEQSFRREFALVVWGACFIVLLVGMLHVFEPRKIVKWDDVLAEAASAP